MKWYIISTLVSGLISILITFIITWNFDAKYIGIYGLLTSSASFAILVFYLGLDQALIRNFSSADNKNQVFQNCFYPTILFFSIFSIVALCSYQIFSEVVYGQVSLILVILFIILVSCLLFQRFSLLVLRCLGKSKDFAIYNISSKFLFISIIFFFIHKEINFDNFTLIYAFIFSLILANIFLIYKVKDYFKYSSDIFFDKKYIVYGFPLLIANIIIGSLVFLDRFLISKWYGYSELGKYLIVCNTGLIFSYLTNLVNIIWMPFVFKNKEKNILDFINVFMVIIASFSLICASSFFYIKDSIFFIFPNQYVDLIKYIYFVLLSAIVYTWTEVPSSIILLKNKTKLNLLAALFNLIFIFSTIPFLKNLGFQYFFLIFFLGNLSMLLLKIIFAKLLDEKFKIFKSLIFLIILLSYTLIYFFEYYVEWFSIVVLILGLCFFVKNLFLAYRMIRENKYEL